MQYLIQNSVLPLESVV